MPYAYTGLDNSDNATVVNVSENNLLPLLVVWLFFTTNPDYLTFHSPETVPGFRYQNLADGLGLSVDCVKNLFAIANKNLSTFQAAASVFQSIAGPGGLSGYGDPTHCGDFDTITEFSNTAASVWNI